MRLYSRPGNDLTHRFPLIVEALARLRSRSCIIDGEAVECDDNGVASFDLVRHHRHNDGMFLYTFDLIELNGDDMRQDPLEVRKATLRSMLAKAGLGLRFNEHLEGDGPRNFPSRSGRHGLARLVGSDFSYPVLGDRELPSRHGNGNVGGRLAYVLTMGSRTRLHPVQGFCAEAGGAMTLFLATYFGDPRFHDPYHHRSNRRCGCRAQDRRGALERSQRRDPGLDRDAAGGGIVRVRFLRTL